MKTYLGKFKARQYVLHDRVDSRMLMWGQKMNKELMRARLRRWQCQGEVVEAGD